MAVQIRSKRKKSFKSNEGIQLEESATPMTPGVEKDVQLNVRRSSRKPKAKKLSDDFEDNPIEIKIKQEPLDEDEDMYNTPRVYTSETPVFGADDDITSNSSARVRRETRKSFQTYLETLGYNADFSKIPGQDKAWQARKKTSSRRAKVNVKTEPLEDFAQTWQVGAEKESTCTPKVQASFQMPRVKKAFASSQKQVNALTKNRSSISHIGPTDVTPGGQKKSTKKSRSRKPAIQKGSQGIETLSAQPAGLVEREIEDVTLDEADGMPTRTSGRKRIPKRQFSLLEVEEEHVVKRQQVLSSSHNTPPEVKKGKQSVTPSISEDTGQSSLVVKRSSARKVKKKHSESAPNSCSGKVKKIIEDINIKREVDTTESSQSETEKKLFVKKGRERIENLVEKLKLAKQSDGEGVEEKTSAKKKGIKRKRESGVGTKKPGKGGKKTNKENKHIVLKLSIPREKDKEKHHHKHCKHKKTKEEGETVAKKGKTAAGVKNIIKVKTNPSAKKKTVKKKTKLMNIKQEKLDEDEPHPHVKLIIKKSPSKSSKIAEVMMQEVTEETLETESNQDSKEKLVVLKKPKTKKNLPAKKYKPLTVKPTVPRPFRKKKDKTMKSRTVSAYSLFTKNRRKGLLEKEPDLDFASTSRRLAEMWKNLPDADQEYWKAKARAVRMPNGRDPTRSFLRSRRGRYDSYNWSNFSDVTPSPATGTEAIDMAAYLKLLGESLCSIGMCLKRQDQMEVHGSLSVLLDTALCSIVPVFCLTSQLPFLNGCSRETQAQLLDNLAYIIPGL